MGMDHIMSIVTLALLLLAEVLVAIILIGVSIEICSYGWKKSTGVKYTCLLLSLLLGTASILGLFSRTCLFLYTTNRKRLIRKDVNIITVKCIDASETCVLRQKFSHPNQTVTDCKYSSDYVEWQHYLTFETNTLEAP